MKSVQAVSFDLFGTLAYFGENFSSFQYFLNAAKKPIRKLALTRSFSTPDDIRAVMGAVSIDIQKEFLRRINKEADSTRLYPETLEVLDQLKMGGYRLALISNIASPFCDVIRRLGIESYFSAVIYSCDFGYTKPDKVIFTAAGQSLNLPMDSIVHVGNHVNNDAKAAREAGMRGVYLNREGAEWNFQPQISNLIGLTLYLKSLG